MNSLALTICMAFMLFLSTSAMHNLSHNCTVPNLVAEGRDILRWNRGFVSLVALMELDCEFCSTQMNRLKQLASMVRKYNYQQTKFVVIVSASESKEEVERWKSELMKDDIQLYQEYEDHSMWKALHGNNNDIFVYDKCNRLTFYIPHPQSFLYYHYTISVIHHTYNGNWCGPCEYDRTNTRQGVASTAQSGSHGSQGVANPTGYSYSNQYTSDTRQSQHQSMQQHGAQPSEQQHYGSQQLHYGSQQSHYGSQPGARTQYGTQQRAQTHAQAGAQYVTHRNTQYGTQYGGPTHNVRHQAGRVAHERQPDYPSHQYNRNRNQPNQQTYDRQRQDYRTQQTQQPYDHRNYPSQQQTVPPTRYVPPATTPPQQQPGYQRYGNTAVKVLINDPGNNQKTTAVTTAPDAEATTIDIYEGIKDAQYTEEDYEHLEKINYELQEFGGVIKKPDTEPEKPDSEPEIPESEPEIADKFDQDLKSENHQEVPMGDSGNNPEMVQSLIETNENVPDSPDEPETPEPEPETTPYTLPHYIPGLDCSTYTEDQCFQEQKSGEPLNQCCYKGVYLTNMCIPDKCSSKSYLVCCFQKFQQARYRCCNNATLGCEDPTDFSKCCYDFFTEDDPCCPMSVAEEHWNVKSRVLEYCIPNLKLDYGNSVLRAQMRDFSVVKLRLSSISALKFSCPYSERYPSCEPYYYQPSEDKSATEVKVEEKPFGDLTYDLDLP